MSSQWNVTVFTRLYSVKALQMYTTHMFVTNLQEKKTFCSSLWESIQWHVTFLCQRSLPPLEEASLLLTSEIAFLTNRCLGLCWTAQLSRNHPDTNVKSTAKSIKWQSKSFVEPSMEAKSGVGRTVSRCQQRPLGVFVKGTGYKLVIKQPGGRAPPVASVKFSINWKFYL